MARGYNDTNGQLFEAFVEIPEVCYPNYALRRVSKTTNTSQREWQHRRKDSPDARVRRLPNILINGVGRDESIRTSTVLDIIREDSPSRTSSIGYARLAIRRIFLTSPAVRYFTPARSAPRRRRGRPASPCVIPRGALR